jgi:hypothetical protein
VAPPGVGRPIARSIPTRGAPAPAARRRIQIALPCQPIREVGPLHREPDLPDRYGDERARLSLSWKAKLYEADTGTDPITLDDVLAQCVDPVGDGFAAASTVLSNGERLSSPAASMK